MIIAILAGSDSHSSEKFWNLSQWEKQKTRGQTCIRHLAQVFEHIISFRDHDIAFPERPFYGKMTTYSISFFHRKFAGQEAWHNESGFSTRVQETWIFRQRKIILNQFLKLPMHASLSYFEKWMRDLFCRVIVKKVLSILSNRLAWPVI